MMRGITRGEESVGRKRGLPAVGEWFEVEPFSTIEGTVCIVRRDYGILPFNRDSIVLNTDFTLTSFAGTAVPRWVGER